MNVKSLRSDYIETYQDLQEASPKTIYHYDAQQRNKVTPSKPQNTAIEAQSLIIKRGDIFKPKKQPSIHEDNVEPVTGRSSQRS